MSDDKQCFFVESPDGRKFKMVIRGDLGRLSVRKIRRYLGHYGVNADCALFFQNAPLADDMIGDDFGLEPNAVLRVLQTDSAGGEAARGGGEENEEDDDKNKNNNNNNKNNNSFFSSPSAIHRRAHVPPSQAVPLKPQTAWKAAPETDAETAAAAKSTPESAEKEEKKDFMPGDGFGRAKENLRVLAEDLALPLHFDANGTCVLNGEDRNSFHSGEGLSLFISYDTQTQRVVLYTTLLTKLPLDNPPLLNKLYEILLEGSLLGREVCGGGIGINKESELVVVQTSFSAIHCDTTLLRDTVPVFVETVRRWRGLVNELMN